MPATSAHAVPLRWRARTFREQPVAVDNSAGDVDELGYNRMLWMGLRKKAAYLPG